jgi:hypothetical protein
MNKSIINKPSRTLGPLHFEDLEPHRFEDMTRQLIYNFKSWNSLEATGRSGRDGGFDIRGTEQQTPTTLILEALDDDFCEELRDVHENEKVWLIQCKREKSINPKKMARYLYELQVQKESIPHGIIFVASCNFSIKTRDVFRHQLKDMGFSEWYLWGKGELEDMLFQPVNDHLLFAYFGISIQVKSRSLKTFINSNLAIKRKLKRTLEPHRRILVRDSEDNTYPGLSQPHCPNDSLKTGRWSVEQFEKIGGKGIHIWGESYFAYVDYNSGEWDYASINRCLLQSYDNPWNHHELEIQDRELRKEWDNLLEKYKAWYQIYYILPYENIIAVDEIGDEFFEGPHIYTTPWKKNSKLLLSPYDERHYYTLANYNSGSSCIQANPEKRKNIFPRIYNKVKA